MAVSWGQSKLFGIGANGTVTELASGAPLNGPAGMDWGSDGELYIGNYNDGNVLRYTGNGNFSMLADIGSGMGFIAGTNNAILATDHANKKIWRVPLDGATPHVIAGSGMAVAQDGTNDSASFAFPNGIVASPSGDTIYVSEYNPKSLRMIVRMPIASGLAEVSENTLAIFPNPAANQLRIELQGFPDILRIELVNTAGEVLQSIVNPVTDSAIVLPIGQVANGLYMVRVSGSNGNTLVKKVSVSR